MENANDGADYDGSTIEQDGAWWYRTSCDEWMKGRLMMYFMEYYKHRWRPLSNKSNMEHGDAFMIRLVKQCTLIMSTW